MQASKVSLRKKWKNQRRTNRETFFERVRDGEVVVTGMYHVSRVRVKHKEHLPGSSKKGKGE